MHLNWYLIIPITTCLIAFHLLIKAFRITKETHNKKTLLEYSPILGVNIIEILFSLTLGLIIKTLPWWLAKIVIILIGVGLIVLGFVWYYKVI